MSPILVRPVREQLEHDRIIRLLHSKLKRRYEAGMNPGNEQNAAVSSGTSPVYPDLVLLSLERGHRLQAVVEVETGESVNHLEALAEWVNFGRLRAAFFLYVPSSMVDVARRLCDDNQIGVSEIWSYHTVGDEVRFTLVHRAKEVARPAPRPAVKAATRPAAAKPSVKPPAAKAAKPKPVPASKAKPKAAAKSRAAKPAARSSAAKKPARAARRR